MTAETGKPRTQATTTSLWFSEEMAGFISFDANDPHTDAENREPPGDRFALGLTIHVDDVDRFLSDPEHLARADGWIAAESSGGRRPIERGWFNLFAPGDGPDRREMRYRLWFTDGESRPRTLVGWKDVHHGPVTRMWLDTSTLFTRLLRGHVPDGEDDAATTVGAGTLHIQPAAFAATLKSFRTEGPHGIAALGRFGRFFVGQLWDVYGPG